MFRIGSFLFIPGYMAVIFRGWPESWVMSGLIASTGIRFCAGTFTFTGMTILLNYCKRLPCKCVLLGLKVGGCSDSSPGGRPSERVGTKHRQPG